MKRAWLMCSHTLFPLVKVIQWILKGGKSYEKDEGKKTKDFEKTGMQPVPAADAAGTGTGSSGNSDPQHHILTSDQNESGRQCTDHTACNCG